MASCQDILFEPDPQNHPQVIYEQFITEFESFYAPFEERAIDWPELKIRYANQAQNLDSEEELYSLLTALMAEFDDGHIQLTTPGREVYYANSTYREKTGYDLFNKEVIRTNYLAPGSLKENSDEGYMRGMTNEGVLYIHTDFVGAQWEHLGQWIRKNIAAKGLIFDLRHNTGGDFTYAFLLAEQLAEEKRLVFTSRTKNGPGTHDYTSWHPWYLVPKGTGYTKPIVVLIDAFTLSAAERATMAFATLPNVTLVGEKTNGSTSTMMARELQNGWYYSLSTQQVTFADGNSYEGKGFPPDVLVQNQEADLAAGKDRVLEKAIALINQ
nr:S41 family peptidase [Cesiribacter sp. SM1]